MGACSNSSRRGYLFFLGDRGVASLVFLMVLLGAAGRSADAASAPVPARGELQIVCSVKGATVRIDGVIQGKIPLPVLSFRSGEHWIRITHGDYLDYVHTVTLLRGKVLRLAVELVPAQETDAFLGLGLEELPSGSSGDSFDADFNDLELEPLKEVELEDPEIAPLELELEPLREEPPPQVPTERPGEGALVPVLGLGQAVPPAPKWYRDWRVLTGAGTAVVLGAVAVGFLVVGDEPATVSRPVDLDHTLCGNPAECGSWATSLRMLLRR